MREPIDWELYWAEEDSKVLLSCSKWAVALCLVALVIEWVML